MLQPSTIVEIPADSFVPYAFDTEDAEFSVRSTSAAARGSRKFIIGVKTPTGEWSKWVEFSQSDDEAEAGVGAQFLRLTNGVDVQVVVELCGYTRHVFLQPVHRIEVRASSIRDRIGAKDGGKTATAHSSDIPEDEVYFKLFNSYCMTRVRDFLKTFLWAVPINRNIILPQAAQKNYYSYSFTYSLMYYSGFKGPPILLPDLD